VARHTAALVAEFRGRAAEALDLSAAAESSPTFTYTRRLHIYEASYLLLFCAWENFLEQSLVRFLCGYRNTGGAYARVGGAAHFPSVAAAYAHLLGGKPYLLWHGAQETIDRSNLHLTGGPHAAVVGSALSDLRSFAAIRNHVAHRTENTRSKFDDASRALIGHVVKAGRAGRLLRTQTTLPATGVQCTWLDRINADLGNYAQQIAG